MTKNIIEDFYIFFKIKKFCEIEPVSIISRHDKSIRFTNSTTSVMKPLFLNKNGIRNKYFLVQPAMGTQGLMYRMKKSYIGKYSSYFVSLGCIYPLDSINEAFLDCVNILEKFGFKLDEYEIEIYHKDKDLIKICSLLNFNYKINTNDSKPFRHKYGLENIFGRNIQVKSKSNEYELACITIIEEKNNSIAVEFSMDSTQVIAARDKSLHSILTLDHDLIKRDEFTKDNYKNVLTLVDSCNIVSILMSEGLKPVSRGRSGILRNFLKEAIFYSKKLDIDKENLINYIQRERHERIGELFF